MQVRVTDPLGRVRYDLYRACEQGVLQLALPLAANDPAGPVESDRAGDAQ